MKITMISVMVLVGAGVLSCTPKKTADGTSNSGLSSVTINQPKLKEAMRATLSEADKTKVYSSLVYQISIKAAKVDNKDDCDAGVTATAFDSDILALDKGAGDTVKVKKGCNYIISMKYGVKADDGKSVKTIYLQSDDNKNPSKLSKEELAKAKPTAVVTLFVTSDGKPYWDINEVSTPSDSDVQVDPTLSSKMTLKADKVLASVSDQANGKMIGSMDLTPVQAPIKDAYCGVVIRAEFPTDPAVSAPHYEDLYVLADVTKSVVKFAAGSVSTVSISSLAKTLTLPNSLNALKAQTAYAVCADTADGAVSKLKVCFDTGSSGEVASLCEKENVIVIK